MALASDLLPRVNAIQDLFTRAGQDPIKLPRIVVVGVQSSGKSSVLESLVGKSFLPRGVGIQTRTPLVLHISNCPIDDPRREGVPYEEWGTFLHSGDRVFKMEELCAEIQEQTKRLAGRNSNIVPDPITLNVFSPHATDLSLVDLPGLTKVPVGEQPLNIEEQTQSLIIDYIKEQDTVILAVLTANTDMATNESLKLAKSVDPDGERTLAVLTKLDLMDRGTHARDVLEGKVIPVKLGIIGVINRSQQDINENKSMEDTLAYEKGFLEAHYADLAATNGTPFLAKKLSKLLLNHIGKRLPELENKMRREVRECEKTLENLLPPVYDKRRHLTSLLDEFCRSFRELCDTGSQDVTCLKLSGGSALSNIVHGDRLRNLFASNAPYEAYSKDEIIAAIRQSNGLRAPFGIIDVAFEKLIKPLIRDMQKPALDCVEDVKKELASMCKSTIPKEIELRYPQLKKDIINVVQDVIDQRGQIVIQEIKDAVAIEVGHKTFKRCNLRVNLVELPAVAEGNQERAFREGTRKQDLQNRLSSAGHEKDEIERQILFLEMSAEDERRVKALGQMLDDYYKTVAASIEDFTAKVIVTFLIHEVRDSLNAELNGALLLGEEELNGLFTEKSDIAAVRDAASTKLQVLQEALHMLSGLVSQR